MSYDILKKPTGKSATIKIDESIRNQIVNFKNHLNEMMEDQDLSQAETRAIEVIINELDDYDRNFIIAYFHIADQSPAALAHLFCCEPYVVKKRIDRIIKLIRKKCIL